jgi:hypothetical protein
MGLGALGSDWTGVEVDPDLMAAAVGSAFLPATTDLVADLSVKADRNEAMIEEVNGVGGERECGEVQASSEGLNVAS